MKRSPLPGRVAPLKRTTPLQRAVQPLKRSGGIPTALRPLRRLRGARRAYERELDSMRLLVLERSAGQCEWREDCPWSHRSCVAAAEHLHHRKLRSAGGKNDLDTLMAVCDHHHRFIHDNPSLAHAFGWLVHPWEDPADIPVNVRRGDTDE